jgi:hypothetical protein
MNWSATSRGPLYSNRTSINSNLPTGQAMVTLISIDKIHLERRLRDTIESATRDVSLSCGTKNIQMEVSKLMIGAQVAAVWQQRQTSIICVSFRFHSCFCQWPLQNNTLYLSFECSFTGMYFSQVHGSGIYLVSNLWIPVIFLGWSVAGAWGCNLDVSQPYWTLRPLTEIVSLFIFLFTRSKF